MRYCGNVIWPDEWTEQRDGLKTRSVFNTVGCQRHKDNGGMVDADPAENGHWMEIDDLHC